MRDLEFRREQRDGPDQPHIAPVKQLVDEPAGQAPGGCTGTVACRRQRTAAVGEPGPGSRSWTPPVSRRLLCVDNDDPTAERLGRLFDGAWMLGGVTTPWNAYPWYVNRAPSAGELSAGTRPLLRLLELLPKLEVVLLLGRHAERSWALAERVDREVTAGLTALRAATPVVRRSSGLQTSGPSAPSSRQPSSPPAGSCYGPESAADANRVKQCHVASTMDQSGAVGADQAGV